MLLLCISLEEYQTEVQEECDLSQDSQDMRTCMNVTFAVIHESIQNFNEGILRFENPSRPLPSRAVLLNIQCT